MAQNPRRLGAAAIGLVVAGIAFVVAVAFIAGAELAVVLYVAPIVVLGILVTSVAFKTRAGRVRPGECHNCGGLVSPNAPYCKHCGAPLG